MAFFKSVPTAEPLEVKFIALFITPVWSSEYKYTAFVFKSAVPAAELVNLVPLPLIT